MGNLLAAVHYLRLTTTSQDHQPTPQKSWGWHGPLKTIRSNFLLAQGQLHQVVHDHIQSGIEHLHRWILNILLSPKMERGRLGRNLVSTSSAFKASNWHVMDLLDMRSQQIPAEENTWGCINLARGDLFLSDVYKECAKPEKYRRGKERAKG